MSSDSSHRSRTPRGGKRSKPTSDDEGESDRRSKTSKRSAAKQPEDFEDDTEEIEFHFTPTHPSKRKAPLPAEEDTEPARQRTKRSTASTYSKTAASASSRRFMNQVDVGVATQIPSKATEGEEPEEETRPSRTRSRRNSLGSNSSDRSTSKKRKTSTKDAISEEAEEETTSPKKAKKAEVEPEAPPVSVPAEPTPQSTSKSAIPKKKTTRTRDTNSETGNDDGKSAETTTAPAPASPSSHIASNPEIETASVSSTKKTSSRRQSTSRKGKAAATEPVAPQPTPTDHQPPVEALPPTAKHTASVAMPKSTTSTSKKGDGKSQVPLEENLVSYWDFVNVERSERLLKKMRREKRAGGAQMSTTTENFLREVQNRFFGDAEARFCPPDQFVENPINEELLDSITLHEKILQLLEKENEELEDSIARLEANLAADDDAYAVSQDPKTPSKRNTPKNTSQSQGTARKSASRKNQANSSVSASEREEFESMMASIMKELPPPEELLSDETKKFLEDTDPAKLPKLDLASFSRLQTKFDALELLAKQIGYINNTFEEKAIGISAAMRDYMLPNVGKPLDFTKLPSASPNLSFLEE